MLHQTGGRPPPPPSLPPQGGGAGFQQTSFAQMQNRIPMARRKVPRSGIPGAGIPGAGIPGAGVPDAGIPSGPDNLPPIPGGEGAPPPPTNPPPPRFELPEEFQNLDLDQVTKMKTDLVRKVLPESAKTYTGDPPPMSAEESEAQYAGSNPAAAEAAERIINEPPPGESSRGDGIDYQDALAGLLGRNKEVYDRDMENVHGLRAKLERDAASNNAIAGSTGAGGFFGALSSGANQQAVNAMADASQKHAAREIDIRLDVLGKQIQQAENAKDRDATKALKDKYEQYLRDRMALQFPLPPDEDELAKQERQKYLDNIGPVDSEGLATNVTTHSGEPEKKRDYLAPIKKTLSVLNPFD